MKSKYLTIKNSTETDSTGNYYPDIMTFPINKFLYNDIPLKVIITAMDIQRFDYFVFQFYNTSDYTDIILWLNNKSSVHELITGEELILPTPEDMDKFYMENI
jgi:hypothetical protein